MLRPFVHLLLAALGPAAAAGVVVGTCLGWQYATAGFPLLLVDAIRRTLLGTLLGTAVFVALYELGRRFAKRLVPARWTVPLAAALAAAPFVALAGYHLNRSWAIHPSEVLEPYALKPNLAFVAACFAAYLVIWAALGRFAKRRRNPRRWGAIAAVALVAVLQGGLYALFRSPQKDRPDVLVLLVDALRADHLGCYGYARDTSPAIDSLARDGVVFRQAITQSTYTPTSIASLFTGRYPFRHGVYRGSRQLAQKRADLLADAETTLAEVMQSHGYLTAAWVQNSHLRRVMGFAQGFVDYYDQQGSIRRIHRRFRPWRDGPGRRYSTFVYLHYIDLHDPYRPQPPYDTLYGTYSDVYREVDFRRWRAYLKAVRRGDRPLSEADMDQLRALYDGQLRAIDDEIGGLLQELRDSGRYQQTLIVLTADHGDAFMEHGFLSHSNAPYEELVRVPLIVKLPGRRFAGRVVESQVRLVDLMPTLLEAVGIDADLAVDGCSLMPRIAQEGTLVDPSCGYAVIEVADFDGSEPMLAIRTERFKYVHHSDRDDELYDLSADPGEQHNLITVLAEKAAPFRRLALDFVARRATDGDRLELDEQILRELRALGYVDD